MEEGLVGLERAIVGQPEARQRRACELHGRLRPRRDQVAVDDCALVDVVIAARVAGRRQVLGGRARVPALVEQPGAGEARRRAADGGHRNAGLEEPLRGSGERHPSAGIPQLAAGEHEDVARAGSRSSSSASGTMRTPPMVVIGSRDSATVTTSKRVPVKRPVWSSARRCPSSQSASVS